MRPAATPPPSYRSGAHRPDWARLPAALRAAITDRLGGPVTAAQTAAGGFTAGFAGVLSTAGDRAFVKAVDLTSGYHLAEQYHREILITAALPAGAPAPRPRWSLDACGWYAICLDAVSGRVPALPWAPAELSAALDAWARAARALRDPPAALTDLGLPRVAGVLRAEMASWRQVARERAPLPSVPVPVTSHVAELAELEAALPGLVDTPGLLHCDLRVDNILIEDCPAVPAGRPATGTGAAPSRAWLCDWTWVRRGAPWFDTAGLLISAHASGLDADRLFDTHPTAAGAPADALDAALAALSGYYLTATADLGDAGKPVAAAHAAHRRFSGETALSWLSTRRGWC